MLGDQWNYAGPECGPSPFNCFFLPTSTCSEDSEDIPDIEFGVMLGRANLYILPNNTEPSYKNLMMHNKMLEPPEWAKELPGVKGPIKRWWEAQMATALFCLREEIIQKGNLKFVSE